MFELHTLGTVPTVEPFDWALFWGAVSAVAGLATLVGVVLAVMTYMRQFPKQRIEYRIVSRRLISQTLKSDSLRLSVRGIEVKDPYFTTVTVTSNSRADVPSSAFDSGKAIVLRVEPGGAVLLDDEPNGSGAIRIGPSEGEGMAWAEFRIEPQLIRKRSNGEVSFVSEGQPSVTVTSPLIDVDMHPVDSSRDSDRRELVVRGAAALSLAVLTGLFTAWALQTALKALFM